MPIPGGRFVISQFSGPNGTPVGTGASAVLLDKPYGFIECRQFDTMPVYNATGIHLQSIDADASSAQYDNQLLTHPGPLIVPNGVGIRFKPEARRVDVELGYGDWGVTLSMGLNLGIWDGLDAVFDFDFVLPEQYFETGLGLWYDFALIESGYWCLAVDGATVLEGNIGPNPESFGNWFIQALASYSSLPDTAGQLSIDKMWLYGVAASAAVRLFPRDDGRGMSSAPRIWPPPPSHRVIGGNQ